jgi:L-ascorbate metabolism protein UlaG (beta-lactamase superfamily)
VANHLRNNPRAVLISTPQARDRLESLDGYDAVAERVQAVIPDEGERIRVDHNDVVVQVLNLHHGRNRPIENLGFLIEFDGVTMLHVGDTEATLADFRHNRLHEEDIDVAFIPYWYLAYDDSQDAVRNGIRAGTIIAMHMPPRELRASYLDDLGGFDKAARGIQSAFANAVVFFDEMETRSFTQSLLEQKDRREKGR